MKNTSAKSTFAASSCASSSSFSFGLASTLLIARSLRSGRSLSCSSSGSSSWRRCLIGSTTSRIASAACAPSQAAWTIARSSRRLGWKMPGVSTRMICVSPSSAMPSRRARVVCALALVIATFWPTSALTSVDLPALGAPITATTPQRVTPSSPARGEGFRQAHSPELLHEQPCGLGLGFLLAARGGLDFADVLHADPNGEARRVIRARAVDHPVLGRAALVAGGPFLQRALGVLGPAGMAVDRRTPDPMNDVAGLFEPAFEQARAEQGLHHVAEHVVAVGGAVVARLLAEADVRRRADGACNRGADLSADQGVEPLGQLALCRGRVVAV